MAADLGMAATTAVSVIVTTLRPVVDTAVLPAHHQAVEEAKAPFNSAPSPWPSWRAFLWWGSALAALSPAPPQGDQGNIASSQQLDMAVPDPEFCRQWGASAFVMDIEMYTTLNPSSSFVTQPTLQPGCVIRRENWSVLRKEGRSPPSRSGNANNG